MNAQEFAQLLRKLGACEAARAWAKGKSLAEVWEQCERGDWLLWLCARMLGKEGWPTHPQIILAACDCAETALKYVKLGEERPRIAIETARRFAAGSATINEVRTAAYAAYAAYADAAYAAYAAYAAAAYAADAAYAAYAYAADAAYAAAAYAADAAYAAAYAADAAARKKSQTQCADLVRARLTIPN